MKRAPCLLYLIDACLISFYILIYKVLFLDPIDFITYYQGVSGYETSALFA